MRISRAEAKSQKNIAKLFKKLQPKTQAIYFIMPLFLGGWVSLTVGALMPEELSFTGKDRQKTFNDPAYINPYAYLCAEADCDNTSLINLRDESELQVGLIDAIIYGTASRHVYKGEELAVKEWEDTLGDVRSELESHNAASYKNAMLEVNIKIEHEEIVTPGDNYRNPLIETLQKDPL